MWLYKIARLLIYPFWRLLFHIRVIGRKNLPKKGGAVIISNHFSNGDPVHIGMLIPRKLEFVAKQELFKNKLIGGLFHFLGGTPINREKPEMATFREVIGKLKKGKMVLVFPEGKRNKTGAELLPLKGGMTFFAMMAKVPLIPMMFFSRPRVFHRNYYMIGEPIDLAPYADRRSDEQAMAELDQKIRQTMLALRERAPEKFKVKERARLEKVRQKQLEKSKGKE